MSVGFFLNMEKIALSIAKDNIEEMFIDNYGENDMQDFINDKKLLVNIKHGFIVLTQLTCFIESFLNTIVDSCIQYECDFVLKENIEKKIDIIFMYYNQDFSKIKSGNDYCNYRKVVSVRNEMIHFKKSYIGDGLAMPDFKIGKEYVAEFFTKNNMNKMYLSFQNLAKDIANKLGLKINNSADFIECNGRDGLVNYVYDEIYTSIDYTRFESKN